MAGVTPHVHPMSRPALGVTRASEEPIDGVVVSGGGGIIDEFAVLLFGGRQAGEVDGHASKKQPAVCGWTVCMDSRLLACMLQEGVNRIGGEERIANARDGRQARRLKCPMIGLRARDF